VVDLPESTWLLHGVSMTRSQATTMASIYAPLESELADTSLRESESGRTYDNDHVDVSLVVLTEWKSALMIRRQRSRGTEALEMSTYPILAVWMCV